MTNGKLVRAVLKYDVDEASVRRAEQSAGRIEERVGQATQKLGQYGLTTRLEVGLVRSRMEDLRQEVIAEIEAFERLEQQVESTGSALRNLPEPNLDARRGDGGGGSDRLEQVDRIGSLGSQLAGAFGSSEIGNAVGIVGDLAGGIQQLGVVGGVTGLALGAVTLALNAFNALIEEQKNNLNDALDGLGNYYDFLAGDPTTDAAQDRLEEIDGVVDVLNEELAALTALRDQAEGQEGALGIFQIAADLLDALPSDVIEERITSVRREMGALIAEYGNLSAALENGRFFVNDQKLQQEQIDQFLLNRLQLLNQADTLSSEQIERRVEQIRLEVANMQELIDSGELSAEATSNLTDKIVDLQNEEYILLDTVSPLVAAREAETDAIQRQQQALEQASASAERFKLNYYDSVEQLQAAQQSLLEAEKGVRAAQEKARENEQRLEQEAVAELEKIQAEADATRSDNIAKNLKAIESQEKAHKDRIAEINRRANATLANAIANRDAVAGLLAVRARDEQLAEEEKANSDRLSELDAALKEQNDVVDKRLREQLANARRAADQRLQLERQRANDELNTRRQALAAAQQQLQSAQAQEQFLFQFHLARLKQIVETGFRDIEAQVEFSLGKIRGGFAPAPGGGGGLKPFGFTQTPSPQTFAYIQPQLTTVNVYAAAKTTTIRNVANSEARKVLYQVLED